MGNQKERIKNLLRGLHLYEPVHSARDHFSDLPMMVRNLGYRIAGSNDHLPIPPAYLIKYTINSNEVSWFLHTGIMSFNSIRYILEKNGYFPQNFQNVLDFGCGLGRTIRHWAAVSGPHIYGTDYNPKLINWDRSHLSKYADFQTNLLLPPLKYADNTFDFAYALSVFTHLTEPLQKSWMDELYRVLQPAGILLITLHGRSRLMELDKEQQAEFLAGKLVIIHDEAAGENICGAYHPEIYVRKKLAHRYELVDFIEMGARDSNQDSYLLRKPLSH